MSVGLAYSDEGCTLPAGSDVTASVGACAEHHRRRQKMTISVNCRSEVRCFHMEAPTRISLAV